MATVITILFIAIFYALLLEDKDVHKLFVPMDHRKLEDVNQNMNKSGRFLERNSSWHPIRGF
jgi:hypothetical protein